MPLTRLLFLSMLFGCSMAACKKADSGDGYYHCTAYALKSPVRIWFVGLSRQELDTVMVKTFLPGSNFSTLLYTSLITDTGQTTLGDTAISNIILDPSDYEVSVPATGNAYRIRNFHEGDSILAYTSNTPCNSPGNGHYTWRRTVDSVEVNNATVRPWLTSYGYTVYLQR